LFDQADKQVPQKVEEKMEADVKEKCCGIVKSKKTSLPVSSNCTVALSRLVIPQKNCASEAIKNESKANNCSVCDGDISAIKTNQFMPDEDTACNGENRTDSSPVSIIYPSCEQNTFLGNFGLANKAALPQLQNVAGNRLHREIGGKLRRSIRPSTAARMMCQRTSSMRCVSFDDSTDAESSLASMQASRESSPRSLHTHTVTNIAIKKLSSVLSKRLKPSSVGKTADSDSFAEASMTETLDDSQEQLPSSLSILADMALAHLDTDKTEDAVMAVKISSVKSKVTCDV